MIFMQNMKRIFLTITAAALCGCAVGPDFESPEEKLSENWNARLGGGRGAAVSDEELAQWWELFGDPELTSLISRAFDGNLSIETAAEKIAQARSTLGIPQSGLFPTLDVNAKMS